MVKDKLKSKKCIVCKRSIIEPNNPVNAKKITVSKPIIKYICSSCVRQTKLSKMNNASFITGAVIGAIITLTFFIGAGILYSKQ